MPSAMRVRRCARMRRRHTRRVKPLHTDKHDFPELTQNRALEKNAFARVFSGRSSPFGIPPGLHRFSQ